MSTRYVPNRVEVSEPPLNTVTVAQIGDNLLRQGSYSEHDAIYVRSDVSVGAFYVFTITPGFYAKSGENDASEFYVPST